MSNLETIETVLWRSSGRIFSTVSTVLRPTFSVCWTVSKKVKRILHGLKQVQRLSYDRKNMVEDSYGTYDY